MKLVSYSSRFTRGVFCVWTLREEEEPSHQVSAAARGHGGFLGRLKNGSFINLYLGRIEREREIDVAECSVEERSETAVSNGLVVVVVVASGHNAPCGHNALVVVGGGVGAGGGTGAKDVPACV